MKYWIQVVFWLYACSCTLSAQEREVRLKFIETSDIHGNLFPFDFISQKAMKGSLSRVHSLVEMRREEYGDNLILIDNGDLLQGEPSVYYYNYIDTTSIHVCADMLNFMQYDLGNMGNHDVEVGRPVFERWIRECNFPVLGANIIETSTGETFLKPYQVIQREGVKVVILGLITPAIPAWLPENLWKGLYFEDMEKSARKWMKIIKKEENPDLIIGLFHSGQFETLLGRKYKDNASLSVARNVPGFDVLLIGHDHTRECKSILTNTGDTVLVVNPANNGMVAAEVDVTFKLNRGKVYRKEISGALTSTDQYNPSEAFMTRFEPQYEAVDRFVNKKIGELSETMTTRDSYFGPSPFVDFIHALQLEVTGADVSFAAPLAFDVQIKAGDIRVSDMFKLYRFENLLYTMRLTGREIKNYLEMSYDLWTSQMKSPKGHLLKLKEQSKWDQGFNALKYFSFNFDSAAGIRYTVDVRKAKGKKILITSMADGTPFSLDKEYVVVVNSYRGNGGGELLTRGAGIPQEKLTDRMISSTDKDFRYYLIQKLEEVKVLHPFVLDHWKFIPEEWIPEAEKRDYKILFD